MIHYHLRTGLRIKTEGSSEITCVILRLKAHGSFTTGKQVTMGRNGSFGNTTEQWGLGNQDEKDPQGLCPQDLLVYLMGRGLYKLINAVGLGRGQGSMSQSCGNTQARASRLAEEFPKLCSKTVEVTPGEDSKDEHLGRTIKTNQFLKLFT